MHWRHRQIPVDNPGVGRAYLIFYFVALLPGTGAFALPQDNIPDGRRLDATFEILARTALAPVAPAPNPPKLLTSRVTRKGSFVPRSTADSCSTQDIRKKMGEVRNQDGLNWCFGSVAADLLSVEAGLRVSDFDLSLRAFAAQGKTPGPNDSIATLAAGSIAKAVEVALREGVCPEQNMPSGDRVLARLAATMERNGTRLSAAELEESSATILLRAIQSMETARGLSVEQLLRNEELACDAAGFTTSMFPQLNALQVGSGLTQAQTNEELFRWLSNVSCQRQKVTLAEGARFKKLIPPDGLAEGSRGFHLLVSLDRRLEKGKPVIVGYRPNRFFLQQTDEMHASIIVGREMRGGECKYLIRNSYGPGCGQYRPPYNGRNNCNRGNFWVSEAELQSSLEFLEFFE